MTYYLTKRVESLGPDVGDIIEIWKDAEEDPGMVEYVCGSDIYPMKRVDGLVLYHSVSPHIIKESEDLNELIESATVLCL